MTPLKRTIAVVTGTRAEYGLLRPVMRAIQCEPGLDLQILVTGTHLLPPRPTANEVREDFRITMEIPMQHPGKTGRLADAASLGRGISQFSDLFFLLYHPHIVLVLGDRIEAFAAAAAASVAGIHLAHMHGGDRAEGIADESLRHAISKLAHIHLPATETSAQRLVAMGEDPQRIHIVGSPAIDGLADLRALSDEQYRSLGSPRIVVLLHPTGDDEQAEFDRADHLFRVADELAPTLVLHPNHDPGRDGIMRAIRSRAERQPDRDLAHLPREQFIGLLRRASVIVGNSSAGLIEAAAIPIRSVNLSRRQAGREKPANVADVPDWDYQTIRRHIEAALIEPLSAVAHPYGDGRTGAKTAQLLATLDLEQHSLRKCNTY